jgi:chemotaxis protein MotB
MTGSKHETIHHEENDEGWLISYADMVTLLFGFFVIMYSLSNVDEQKFQEVSEKLAAAFKAPEDGQSKSIADYGVSYETRQIRALHMLVAMLNLGDDVEQVVKQVETSYSDKKTAEALKDVIENRMQGEVGGLIQQLKQSKDDRNVDTVEMILPNASLFPSGGHDLAKGAASKLKILGAELRQSDELLEVEIIGHTDASPPKASSAYRNNFSLSSLRAGAVAEALIEGGLSEKIVTIRGMGSQKPLFREKDRNGQPMLENMQRNRRVQVIVKKKRHDPNQAG